MGTRLSVQRARIVHRILPLLGLFALGLCGACSTDRLPDPGAASVDTGSGPAEPDPVGSAFGSGGQGGAGSLDGGLAGGPDASSAGGLDAAPADTTDSGEHDQDQGPQPAVDVAQPPPGPDAGSASDSGDGGGEPACIDNDGDGAGQGCAGGPDCDDGNPHFTTDCPNCAALVAEGCPCPDGVGQALCYSADPEQAGTGACALGTRACADGYWSGCTGEVLPAPEVCDGADNDCDGVVDEGLTGCGEEPSCVDDDGDGFGTACPAGDDCDDSNPLVWVDCAKCAKVYVEGCPCTQPGVHVLCYSGDPGLATVGECSLGERTCVGDAWTGCLGEVLPAPETCDELDNDCDGAVDEGLPGCGDVPPCVDGDGDGFGDGCAAGPDCDDGDPLLAADCGACAVGSDTGCPCANPGEFAPCYSGDPTEIGLGECKAGVRTCDGAVWTDCQGDVLPMDEVCDEADNDCDGEVDEDIPGCEPPPTCVDADGDGAGQGCAGGPDCDDGNPWFVLECPDCSKGNFAGCPCGLPGKTAWCYSGDALLVGIGQCQLGARSCADGYWTACTGEVLPEGETCDTVDNDCDGKVDEDLPGCGVPPTCVDSDGDGYGTGCQKGPDCNDNNPVFNVDCPDCTQYSYEGCPCLNPGQQKSCYTGDAGLLGIGQCAAGLRTCDAGLWTGCVGEVLPWPELCDGADNDCDGAVDEGVLGDCGDCNPLCHLETAGVGGEVPFNPTPQNSSDGVVLTPEGWLTLAESSYSMHFIWISNSAENTVSKLDTITGKELGRYSFCQDPSRTAVDPNGDGWVACRGDGKVAKIRNITETCPDKNGNGVIETSTDINGDGMIKGSEMLPKGQDECVLFATNPANDSLARALGVDAQHHAWVGWWNSKTLRRIHPDTGAIVDTISIPANPYGLVIDSKGIVWVSGRGGNQLVRVDPATHAISTYSPGGCFEPYGITVDEWDRIWIANCCCANVAYVFNPAGGGWGTVPTQARPRGIASNHDGFVFVANDQTDTVAKIDGKTLKTVGYAAVGGGRFPLGIAVDSQGFVWSVNQSSSSATKINPTTLGIELEHPVGSGPYTYSDMTGSTFFKNVVPKGTYRLTYEGPVLDAYMAEWYEIVWETLSIEYAAPGGTSIQVRARVSDTKAGVENAPWSATVGPYPPKTFPLDLDATLGPAAHGKRFLQIEVILNSADLIKPFVKGLTLQYALKSKS